MKKFRNDNDKKVIKYNEYIDRIIILLRVLKLQCIML